MDARSVIVAVLNGEEVVTTKEISKSEGGQPVRIQAQHGRKYLLAEGEDALAPDNIVVKRVGKDLHIAVEGADPDSPQLIIEDYYEYEGQLIGMSENGTYHEYVAINNEHDQFIPFLIDGSSSVQALAATELEGYAGLALLSGGVIPTSVLGLGALGLLGGAAAVENQVNNDSGHNRHPDTPGLERPSIERVADDAGSHQGGVAKGGVTDDSTPTFSGKGEPHATVRIYDGETLLGSSIVDESGSWSFTPSKPLQDGLHNITVINENGAGNVSEPSDQFNFIVDTIPPVNSGIDSAYDDRESIDNGGLTSSNKLVFEGAGEPGSIVTVLDNGSVIGEVVVNEQGRWVFIPDQALSDGSHKITVIHTDPAGNSSDPSSSYEVVIDTLSPDKPIISSVFDDAGSVTGLLQSGEVTDDATPLISGTAEAASTVVVYDNGVEIGRVIADVNGLWSFTPREAMVSGFHQITVKAIDAAGNTSLESESFDLVLVNESVLPAPTIDSVYDSIGSDTGFLQSNDVTDDAKPTLSGTAVAGSTVMIFDNGAAIGQVLVGPSGVWSFEPAIPLLNGNHVLSAMAVDDDGNHSQLSPEFTFTVWVGGVPTAPAINTVKDDVGTYTGALQKEDATDDTRPTIEGTARPGHIVTVYDNGYPIGMTKADDKGFWSFTPAGELDDGVHRLTVTSRNGEGPESSPSGAFTITVDTQAPNPPSNLLVIDDHNGQQPIEQNGVAADSTPKFTGTSEPYNFIQIKDGDSVLGTVLADSMGRWEFTPMKALSNGLHSITITATDEAGNTSEPSPAFDFTVTTPLFGAAVLSESEGSEVVASGDTAFLALSLGDVLVSDMPELFKEASESDLNAGGGLSLELELDNFVSSVADGPEGCDNFDPSINRVPLEESIVS